MNMKASAAAFGRTLATALVVTIIIIIIVSIAFHGQTQQTNRDQDLTVAYARATACELALPSNPATGRDPDLVARCFTDAGLPAPSIVAPSP